MLRSRESNIVADYYGHTDILCGEHDYKEFPGLNEDLIRYAKNWKGGGWDDIKVNVEFANGTKIVISDPTVKPKSLPTETSVVIAQDRVLTIFVSKKTYHGHCIILFNSCAHALL